MNSMTDGGHDNLYRFSRVNRVGCADADFSDYEGGVSTLVI